MKKGREEIDRAARIRAAVDQATAQGSVASIGARIEELTGFPLDRYPDEVLSLDLLPTIDGLRFIGWTADFQPVECRQDLIGQSLMVSASCPLVGWKPLRAKPLLGRIAPQKESSI